MKERKVLSVSYSSTHTFSKTICQQIQLIKGHGIEGDAHFGKTVKHRSRVAKDPNQPNLRQVHLLHFELLEDLINQGFRVNPGDIGENITTQGIDILSLPKGTILKIGNSAKIQITGLRNPCHQLDKFQKGLMKAVLDKDCDGNLIRKSGIMGIVLESGVVKVNDPIMIEYPPKPHLPLKRV